MAIFNSYVKLPQGIHFGIVYSHPLVTVFLRCSRLTHKMVKLKYLLADIGSHRYP